MCCVLVGRCRCAAAVQPPTTLWPAVDLPFESDALPRSSGAQDGCWRLPRPPAALRCVMLLPCCHATCRRHARLSSAKVELLRSAGSILLAAASPVSMQSIQNVFLHVRVSFVECACGESVPIARGEWGGEWGENKGRQGGRTEVIFRKNLWFRW